MLFTTQAACPSLRLSFQVWGPASASLGSPPPPGDDTRGLLRTPEKPLPSCPLRRPRPSQGAFQLAAPAGTAPGLPLEASLSGQNSAAGRSPLSPDSGRYSVVQPPAPRIPQPPLPHACPAHTHPPPLVFQRLSVPAVPRQPGPSFLHPYHPSASSPKVGVTFKRDLDRVTALLFGDCQDTGPPAAPPRSQARPGPRSSGHTGTWARRRRSPAIIGA